MDFNGFFKGFVAEDILNHEQSAFTDSYLGSH